MHTPPPLSRQNEHRIKRPTDFKDFFRFVKELFSGFLTRFGYILGLVWKTGPWILIAMSAIALAQGLVPVISSILTKNVVNELQLALTGGLGGNFWNSKAFYYLVFFFAVQILNRLVMTLSNAINRISGERVVKQVKTLIMKKSLDIDIASFDRVEFYEKLENANREAGNRPIQIIYQVFSIISTFIQLIGYAAVIATAGNLWWAVIVIALVSAPSALVSFLYRRKNFHYVRHRSKERRQMSYYSDILVNKDMVKEVRIFGLGNTFIERYKTVFTNYYQGLVKLILSESAWHTVIAIITAIVNCLLYALIASKVFMGEIMLGDYSLYTSAIMTIAACISTLINNSATIYEGTLFIDNLIAFMNEESTMKVPENAEKVLHNSPHTIEFKNVSFKYPGADTYVLKNINLKFQAGETVVLVGLNGAGKTTLIKLLTRLYDPTEGEILLDGKNLKDYDIQDLYNLFGIIFQDFGKYAVTAGENIHFGDIEKEYSPAEIKKAAEKSNAADYIEALPLGYDTPLMRIFEHSGLELSIGQWQKLAIARAFYSDSDILILDEPTASLDPMAEQEIFNQFDALRKGKTTIFVSHRLSSATVASQIVVLENGEVAETGTHHELMEKAGKYHMLFTTQAKRYLEK